MSGFTDVFGGQTVPPSEYGYASYSLTVDGIFYWPEQYSGIGLLLANIVEFTSTAGLSLFLPAADAVSTGRDFLLVNIGADTLTVKDTGGSTVATIPAGIGKYFYLKDNTTPNGLWNVLTYGAGSNTLDAGSLAGEGLQANGSELETNNLYRTIAGNYTIVLTDRAHVVNVTAGSVVITAPPVASVGDGFWFMLRNSSIGSVTLEGDGSETVDSSINKIFGPNESALVICNGTSWFTVGYGRDVNFVFTEYVINAAVGDITLSSSDVSGRMIRVAGTATTNFTVTMPTIDNIYFVIVEAGMGGFTVTFETAIGTGVTLSANQNVALYSDGTNIAFAVTTAAVSQIDLNDGLATAPSLRFLLDADTGIYRPGANILGFTAGGIQNAQLDTIGFKTLAGAVGTPSYSFLTDTDTGFFHDIANKTSFAGNGIKGGQLGALGFESIDGSFTNPSYTFVSDPDTGLYRVGANQLGVACAGANVATFGGAQSFTADSPVFTGNPTAPTPALEDNDTSLATTAFVMNAFSNGFGGGSFGAKNKIINGRMEVAQRGASFVAVAGGAYTLDRWRYDKSASTAVHTVSQDSTDVPTAVQAGTLFNYSLRLNLTTADTAIAAGDFVGLTQLIEGYNYASIAQNTFTLSFWVKATLAGIYCVAFRNSGGDRSYIAEYTINATNTWERKTISVSASPSAGTWDYTTGVGLRLNFTLAAGATFQTTAGTWNVGNFFATANQVNGVNTGATDFRVTGVQIEAGVTATPFENKVFSSEVSLCQRYYEKSFSLATTPVQNAGVGTGEYGYTASLAGALTERAPSVPFKVTKRATPTVTLFNPAVANAQVRDNNAGADCSASAVSITGDNSFQISCTGAAGTAVGNRLLVHWTAEAEL